MAKIQIKSEKITPFGGIYQVFHTYISGIIYLRNLNY